MEKLQPIRIFLINFFTFRFRCLKSFTQKKIKKSNNNKQWTNIGPQCSHFMCVCSLFFHPSPFFMATFTIVTQRDTRFTCKSLINNQIIKIKKVQKSTRKENKNKYQFFVIIFYILFSVEANDNTQKSRQYLFNTDVRTFVWAYAQLHTYNLDGGGSTKHFRQITFLNEIV